MRTVTKNELMGLEGYTENVAKNIIKMAKAKLVESGFEFYNNSKLGRVPITIVEEILGFEFCEKCD